MDQQARVERLKATVAKRRAAGLLCGRPKRTDLDETIRVNLAAGFSVLAVAKELGCHPRLVRRVRDAAVGGGVWSTGPSRWRVET